MKIGRFMNRIAKHRAGRIGFLLAAFILLATVIPAGPPRPPPASVDARLTAVAVALDEANPALRRIGRLLYRRGWALSSDDPRFGAISAMHVENGRVTALSDAGTVFEFALPGAAGSGRVRFRPLSRQPGGSKRSRDTESLAIDGARAWIGFEAINAVKRFRRVDWHQESETRPAAMRPWGGNSGAEAMVRLEGGRFLVFSEGRDNGQSFSPVLLFDDDPAQAGTRVLALRYRRPAGFRVTDAALLPDGRLLILNRRLGWLGGMSASLVVAPLPPVRADAVIAGREIAVLQAPLTVSNMEALSVAREGGRTIVRIASDDNFMPLLRTLLLEFVLVEDEGAG